MDKHIRKKMLAVILTLAMVAGLMPTLTLSAEATDHSVTLTGTATTGTFFHITAADLFGDALDTGHYACVGFTRPVLTGSDPAVYGDIAYQAGTPYIGADGTSYGFVSGMSVFDYPDYYFIANTAGTYTFTAYYDDEEAGYIDNYNVTLSVSSPATAPTVSTSSVNTYTATSAILGGNVIADGGASVTDRGVVYSSTDATPRIGETGVMQDSNGSGTGTFSESVTGFSSGTIYYVCAYATNTAGTSYGAIVSFTTTGYWKDNAATGYAGGSGTSASPYLISSAEQLAYFSNQVNAGSSYNGEYFKLTDDINLSGKLWTPIGNSEGTGEKYRPFDGIFDGDGHVVTSMNATVSASGSDILLAGLFGFMDFDGIIKNLGVTGTAAADMTGSADYAIAGGLVADNYGAITNCYSRVTVTSSSTSKTAFAGGLVGGCLGTVNNCYATGNISCTGSTGAYAGVLIGNCSGAIVSNAYYNSDAMVTGMDSGAGTPMTSALMKDASFVTTLNTNKGTGNNSWAAVTDDYPTYASLPTVTLSVNNSSIAENGGSATVTATLSAASASSVTVTLGYTGTAAGSGTDYTVSSATITIAAGNTSGTATVTAVDDALDETDETIIAGITGVTEGAEIGTPSTVTITITDNDFPNITVSDASVTEGNSGTAMLTFTVSLSGPSSKTVTANYATADVTATAGTDYTAASGTLTFSPGETSKTVVVTVFGDTVTENTEIFFLNLTNVQNANIVDGQGMGTIINDDAVPDVSVNDVSVTEGNSGTKTLTFTVTLNHASASSVWVDYATANNTATAGTDYTAATGTLTFSPGETSKTVGVTIAGDSDYEPDESFFLDLISAPGCTIADNQGVGTITNDDAAPTVTLSVDNSSIAESGGIATVTATLSATSASPVTVTLGYTGTAAGSGTDYTASSATITIAAGSTSGTATITAVNDALDETDETVIVDITGVTNGTESGTQQITVTITDNDAAPSVSVNDASVTEGNSGTATLTFTVTLSAASGRAVTVDYATTDGTAKAGTDYTAATGTLTFSAGDTSKTVSVTVLGDTVTEPNENLFLNLTKASNANIADNQGVGTITNDDAPTVTLSVDNSSIAESGGIATVTATLSGTSASTVTVTLGYTGTAAGSGTDYTVSSATITIAAGNTSGTAIITAVNDELAETAETVIVDIAEVENGTESGTQQITVTITDDDAIIEDAISNKTITVTETSSKLFDNSDGKITAEANMQNAFSNSVEIKVTDTEEDASNFSIGIGNTVYPFDISLYLKGTNTKTEPNDGYAVTISLPIPDELLDVKDQLLVMHKSSGGTVTTLASQRKQVNGVWYLVFKATEFSPYALVVSDTDTYDETAGLPYYVDGNGADVFIGFAANGKYVAPDGMTVLFKKNPKNFSDTGSYWAENYINFVTERELFNGTGNDRFLPNTGMTRAMFATVIGRLYERSYGDIAPAEEHAFTDCDYSDYYGKYVDWAFENGIAGGTGGGLFEPDMEITREEAAVILYRFADFLNVLPYGMDTELSCPDAGNISSWAKNAALYCQSTGIITGRGGGNFVPHGTATRAEASVMLERFVEYIV